MTHPDSIKKLIFTELEWCYVQLNNQQIFKAYIQRHTILSEYLVILNLKSKKELTLFPLIYNYSVFLNADNIGYEKFREVKRYLRLFQFEKKGMMDNSRLE